MPEAVLTEEECNVDVCVLGTGLIESLVAAALARREKRVLHLDRLSCYGGNWRALNLLDFEKWANGAEDTELSEAFSELAVPVEDTPGLTMVDVEAREPISCFTCRSVVWDPFNSRSPEELEALQKDVRKSSNAFNIDLVPRLLFGRSGLVDVLVESGVARYLEFQGLKSARVLSANGLLSVPMTKAEIFQDPVLTLPEKRTLMRFITSMMPFVGSLAFHSPAQLGVDQARKIQGPTDPGTSLPDNIDLDEPWCDFLKKQKLSPRLQDFVTYAICMWDGAAHGESATLLTREGLRCLGRFVSSLGLHGRGTSMPLLYPMYGASEIAQGFTRMCALHRGTYALRTAVTSILAEKDPDTSTWRAAGVITNRGEVIKCRSLVVARDFVDVATAAAKKKKCGDDANATSECGAALSSDAKTALCVRMTALADCAVISDDGLGLCVVPPSALEPPLSNVVQVLQLEFSTGTCPRGYTVLHLSQVAPKGLADRNDPFGDLQRVLDALLGLVGGSQHCLLRCSYLHETRARIMPDADGLSSAILDDCCKCNSLGLCSDPSAVPQLLADSEVDEARALFLNNLVHGADVLTPEDFLEKPVHVALEEKNSTMDELEAFNEEMQEAAQPRQKEAAAALEQNAQEAETAAEPSAGASIGREEVNPESDATREAEVKTVAEPFPGASVERQAINPETDATREAEVEAIAEPSPGASSVREEVHLATDATCEAESASASVSS